MLQPQHQVVVALPLFPYVTEAFSKAMATFMLNEVDSYLFLLCDASNITMDSDDKMPHLRPRAGYGTAYIVDFTATNVPRLVQEELRNVLKECEKPILRYAQPQGLGQLGL
ncbi:hypothetical protein F5146DRAFT_1145229 [Armillaria mellea]|nr:hypothetical protein F5146DRAFT_1145229 [Armillaria mellea]